MSSSSPEKSIATRQLWLFAAAAVPPAMLNFPVAAYLPSYYAQHAGLSMATVGLVFMLARIFDFITDPIMGVLTDRTRSRWGARRPWVFISIPMLLASVWALFFPPNDIGVAWLVVSLFSMTAAATVLSITHNAWSADLAVGYNERSRVQAVIVMLTIGGALASMVLPAIFEAGAADPVVVRSQSLGLLLLVLTVPTVAMTLLSGAESPTPEAKGVGENPFKAIYAALRRQPYLARLLFADFAQGAAAGTLGALSLYVATAKGLADRASLLILCFYITALIAIPAWNRLSYRLGKRQTIGFASILSIVLFLSMTLVPSGNLVLGCIAFTILGIPASAWMFLMKSIVADCIEIEEKAVGQPRAGMIFSLFVLTQKLSAAIAVGLSFMMLSAIGFAPGAPMSESQAAYILGTVTAVCCFGHAVMAWVSFRGQSSQRIANEVATSS